MSVYGAWEKPHSVTQADFIYADASVHRLISDLCVFISKRQRQNILVAGDLNVLYGYGEHGDAYWAARYETVFSRMAALGLKFAGPQAPHGRRALQTGRDRCYGGSRRYDICDRAIGDSIFPKGLAERDVTSPECCQMRYHNPP